MEVSELLGLVGSGRWGLYYTIWYVIAGKASAVEAASPLFEVVSGDGDYLYRYHAAAALIRLTGIGRFEPVDLSGNHSEVKGNILEMESLLRKSGLLSN